MRNYSHFSLLATAMAHQLLLVGAGPARAAGADTGTNPLILPLLTGGLLVVVALFVLARIWARLQALRHLTDSMIDALSALIIGLNGQQQIVEVNRKAADFLGKEKSEIVGGQFADLFGSLPVTGPMIEKAQNAQATVVLDRVLDKKLDRCWAIRLSPWARGHDRGVILQLEERTEQAHFETLMVQKDKLFTVSRLAVGMMHEINNPLASILQNLQVIHNRFGIQLQKNRQAAENAGTSMEKIARYLQERGVDRAIEAARDSARRAALVIETLVNFTRQDDENEALHSLSNLLERALDLAAADFDLEAKFDFRQIKIERDYDPALPPVRCRALKLQQAFLPLFHFRAEELLKEECSEAPQLWLKLSQEGDQARLQLEDNGPQPDQEQRRRIFRPSLNAPGQGLGLCVSQFIICDLHGGTLSFEKSSEGRSRLVVRLPLERHAYG